MSPAEVARIVRSYADLALAIDRRLSGYIAVNYAPWEWQAAAAATPLPSLSKLALECAALADMLVRATNLDCRRRDFLESQVAAMSMTIRLLSGEQLMLAEQAQALYDINPEWIDESCFQEAHHTLDLLLPPGDSLGARLATSRAAAQIASGQIAPLLGEITTELQRRTRAFVPLPESEELAFEFVTGQAWGACNWYKGNYRSTIAINTDHPFFITELAGMLAHEAYPGHHTELAIKEQCLVQGQGCLEWTVVPLHSPACLVSEGIATHAMDLVLTQEEWIDWQGNNIWPRYGFGELDARREYAIQRALKKLRGVSCNVALLLSERSGSLKDAVDYLQRYGLSSQADANKTVSFLTHPLFRSYTFTHYFGNALLDPLMADDLRRQLWVKRLFTEPVTPRQIRKWATAPFMRGTDPQELRQPETDKSNASIP